MKKRYGSKSNEESWASRGENLGSSQSNNYVAQTIKGYEVPLTFGEAAIVLGICKRKLSKRLKAYSSVPSLFVKDGTKYLFYSRHIALIEKFRSMEGRIGASEKQMEDATNQKLQAEVERAVEMIKNTTKGKYNA